MTAVDDGSSTNSSRKGLTSPPAVGGAEKKSNTPRARLKRPLTREDIPHAQSTVKLFKGLINGAFTERQRQCIAKDVAVGPIYEAVMVRKSGCRTLFDAGSVLSWEKERTTVQDVSDVCWSGPGMIS